MCALLQVGSTLLQLEDSVSKAVSHYTLEVVQPRVISFEDQVGVAVLLLPLTVWLSCYYP